MLKLRSLSGARPATIALLAKIHQGYADFAIHKPRGLA